MAAHVSAVPNHQTGRVTPLFTRAAVAMFGAFGYELDPTAMPDDEQAEVARQVAWYAERRELLQRGRFLRLRSPFEHDGNETAWMAVDDEGSRAVVGFYRVLARPLPVRRRIRLRGLDPAATYRVTTWMDTFAAPVATADRAGDELMAVGLGIEPPDMPIPRQRVVRRHAARARRLPGAPVRRRQALTRPRTISSGPRRCSRMQREANVRRHDAAARPLAGGPMSSSEAAHIPIFATLKGRDRDKVLGNATQRTYAPGATLVAEGERSVNLFFIAQRARAGLDRPARARARPWVPATSSASSA